jgi:hypothetical protein
MEMQKLKKTRMLRACAKGNGHKDHQGKTLEGGKFLSGQCRLTETRDIQSAVTDWLSEGA